MPQEARTTAGKSTAEPRGEAEKVRQHAKQAADSMRGQADRAAQTAREGLSAAADNARDATTEAARRAKEGAESFMARQKDSAAAGISHLSEAVQRAADKLHDEQDHNIACYAEAAADRARSAAQYLEQHDLSDVLADMQGMARRHPAALCGGMFVAGVTLARFLKATSPASRHADGGPQTWQSTQPPAITTT